MNRAVCSLLPAAGAIAASVWFSFLALSNDANGQPVLKPDTEKLEFGTVFPSIQRHTFSLTNRGSYPVKFHRIEQQCGCTKVELATHSLAPSNSVDIPCEFDLAGRRGRFETSFSIYYSVPDKSSLERRLRFDIEAHVTPIVTVTPEIIEFTDGVSSEAVIAISSRIDKDVTIRNVSLLHRSLKPVIADDAKSVTLRFDPSKWLDGPGVVTLRLETSNEREPAVPIQVRVVRALSKGSAAT